ncbi:MAG: MATE family efflux transporter [Clostridiales bacterium]|nr:MATE family efflux transporter [Clostridiales bacterium]
MKKLVLPIIIEQLLASTIGLFDTIMVSSAGEAAVAGVSTVDSLNLLLINLFMGIATGTTVVISQYIGANRYKDAKRTATQSLWASIFISVLIMTLCVIDCHWVLSLLFGKIEQDVMGHAVSYFLYSAISYPFLAVYSTCAAIYRAKGNATATMIISIIMNIINVSGNAIFIYGFKMGAGGAALSSLISRAVGAMIMVLLLLRRSEEINIRKMFPFKFQWDVLKLVLLIGLPAAAESVIFQLGKVMTQSFITGYGTEAITANGVVNTIFAIALIPGNSLNIAIMTVVGQLIGAGKTKEAKRYVWLFGGIVMLLQVFTNSIIYAVHTPVFSLFGLGDKTAAIANQLLLSITIVVPVLWAASFTIPAGLRASGDVKFPMIISICTMWFGRVLFGYLLGSVFGMGVLGIWIGMYLDWLLRAPIYILRLRKRDFKKFIR